MNSDDEKEAPNDGVHTCLHCRGTWSADEDAPYCESSDYWEKCEPMKKRDG